MPTIAIAGIVAATALVALIVITGLVLLRRFRRDARGRFVDEEGIEKLRPSNGGSAAGVPAPSRASISSLASSVSLDPAAAHQPLSGLSRLAPMSGPSPGHKSVKHASPSAFQMPAGFHIQQQQLSQLQATLPLSQMHSQQAPPASSAPFVAFVSKQPPRDISFGSSVVSATSSTAASTLIAPTSVAGSASVSPSLLSATPVPSGYAIPVPTSSPPREDIFADPADATPTQSSVALQQLQQQQQQQQRQTQPKKISATAFSSEDARLIAQAFRQELIDPSHDWETHSDTSSMAASRQSSKVSQKSNRSSLSNPFGTGSRPVNSTDEGSAQ
nr:hypothetical protein HK105_003538 [Polyrhizophydium stewartii]